MAHAGTSKKSARVSGRRKAATAIVERNARAASAKSDRSTSDAKRRSRSLKKSSAASPARKTKSACALDLLRRAEGATLTELMATTGWQAHSVRGFLSGTVRKRLQLPLRSAAGDGGRRYKIDAGASTHDAS
jgi:hypothetical protein